MTGPDAVTDPPPPAVQADLDRLRSALDQHIPPRKVDGNLLVATWNLRAFGGLTERWEAEAGDEPKRDLHALLCIAEVVSRFDVVAVQEVKGNIKALRHLLKSLGDDWGLILTDVTKGGPGNDERMAFLFDTRRLRPSGLACEIVLPSAVRGVAVDVANALDQFARTPYAVSFLAAGRGYRQTFVLLTLHVVYGKKPKRQAELQALADWAADMARDMNAYHQNLIVLGDFNIERKGDPLWDAFCSTGLRVPKELEGFSRTLPTGKTVSFYDQIAWFTGENDVPALSLHYNDVGGNFDFFDVVFPDVDVEALSWKMSDHFPLWVEFLTK